MIRRLKYTRKALVLLVALGFFSCGSSTWTSEQRSNLLDRCDAEGGSNSYCNCYLENAMQAYPNAEDMDEIDFETAVELSLDCL